MSECFLGGIRRCLGVEKGPSYQADADLLKKRDLCNMSFRVLQHILFWLTFGLLYVIMDMLFAAPSDMAYPPVQRFFRFCVKELAFLPWKMIPFYFLFYYLIPKYFRKGHYLKMAGYFFLSIIVCLFGYRSMIAPVTHLMYGEIPDFNVYSLKRFLYSLTEILPAIGLASTIKLLKGSVASRRKEMALQKEKMDSELSFLKAQTDPHFLFNTLNNLYGLARKNDENTAPSIMKLSNIMRFILHECSSSRIPVEKEIKVIEDYMELEKLRYDDRLKVCFNKAIEKPNQQIAPLILLPFVENAFKHGAGESRFDILINIDLMVAEEILTFRIENNYDPEEAVETEGIGLKNVKRQLDLIYGKKYSLNIQPGEDTFLVDLSIKMNHYDQQ